MKNKSLLLGSLILPSLFILLALPMVNAQPPSFVEPDFSEGLFVEFTPLGIFKQGQDIQFNAHVFNFSNGVEMDNSTIVCKFSLFDTQGFFILENENMSFNVSDNNWQYTVSGSDVNEVTDYAALIDCQDSTNLLGGFVTLEFILTPNGELVKVWPMEFSWLAFAVIFIIFGFLFERATMFQVVGSMMVMFIGVLALGDPGFSIFNGHNTSGIVFGVSLIGLGAYYMVEMYFSRGKQAKRYSQREEDD